MKTKIIISAIMVNIILIGYTFLYSIPKAGVYFFNIGQGDASYIRTDQNQDILIDGGPSTVILSKLGEVMPFWDREIDIIILTHPHADHVTGLIEVLKRYRVKRVFLAGALHNTYEYIEFLKMIKKSGAQVTKIDHQLSVVLSSQSKLEFLYPDFDVQKAELDNLNSTSIVVKFITNDTSFLFTGDIEKDVEEYLIKNQISPARQSAEASRRLAGGNIKNQKYYLSADILKVAHQGSRTSSTQEFLQAVNPRVSIITVGQNNFGHPHQEVLDRLTDLGIIILRTDQQGDIIVKYDGVYSFSLRN